MWAPSPPTNAIRRSAGGEKRIEGRAFGQKQHLKLPQVSHLQASLERRVTRVIQAPGLGGLHRQRRVKAEADRSNAPEHRMNRALQRGIRSCYWSSCSCAILANGHMAGVGHCGVGGGGFCSTFIWPEQVTRAKMGRCQTWAVHGCLTGPYYCLGCEETLSTGMRHWSFAKGVEPVKVTNPPKKKKDEHIAFNTLLYGISPRDPPPTAVLVD